MRPTLTCAVALAAGLAASLVAAQGNGEQPLLPFNPYAQAKEGDWECLLATAPPKAGQTAKRRLAVDTYRVTKVTEDRVFYVFGRRLRGSAETKMPETANARTGSTMIRLWANLPAEIDILDTKTEDDTKVIAGKEFKCSKVVVKSRPLMPPKPGEVAVTTITTGWISKEIGAFGLIAMTRQERDGDPSHDKGKEWELAGYGNGDKIEWGSRPEDVDLTTVAKDEGKNADDPANTKLPFNPYGAARTGDWACYVTKITATGEKGTSIVQTARITAATEEKVTLAGERRFPDGTVEKEKLQYYSKKDGTTLGDCATLGPGEKTSDVKIAEDRKKTGGKEFACTKVTFNNLVPSEKEGEPVRPRKAAVWYAKDVRTGGVVAFQWTLTRGPGNELRSESELVGFGNGDKVEWGKKPEDVELPAAKKDASK